MPYSSKHLSYLLSPIFGMLYQQTFRMLLPGNSLNPSLKEKFLTTTMTKSAARTLDALIADFTWELTKAKNSKTFSFSLPIRSLLLFYLSHVLSLAYPSFLPVLLPCLPCTFFPCLPICSYILCSIPTPSCKRWVWIEILQTYFVFLEIHFVFNNNSILVPRFGRRLLRSSKKLVMMAKICKLNVSLLWP